MSILRVVLVEPQIPANMGFVARALDNFGVHDWVAVGGCAVEGTDAEKTGAPAKERLDALRRVGCLEEALQDCVGAIGFTARGGHRRPPINLESIHQAAAERGLVDGKIALVFGREDRGLEAQECEACSLLVTIPTEGLGSLNLSHAVTVGLYEWFRGQRAVEDALLDHQWSVQEERAQAAERAWRLLEAAEFPHHGDQLHGLLRRLVAQPMESRDLRALNKIMRHVEFLKAQD
ncbi:MAG: RNA methyltransferase [Planctomycetota bacterium]